MEERAPSRSSPLFPAGSFNDGHLEVRSDEHAALVHGRPLHLTVRELEVLSVLASRPGRVVSRADLYRAVWGRPFRSYDRSVDVYVSRLRAKLEAALPDWRYIHTHVGFGYRFSPEPLHLFHTVLTQG